MAMVKLIVKNVMDKMIKSYKDFILEAKMEYFSKFEDILYMMKSPISTALLELRNKNVNVNFNYFNLASSDDLISFIQDDKIGNVKILFQFTEYPMYSIDSAKIKKFFGITEVKSRFPIIGTIGWIKNRIYDPSVADMIKLGVYYPISSDIVHFVDLDGGDYILEIDTLKSLDKLSSNLNSQESRIGRLVRRVVSTAGYNFSDLEYENFVTEFKSKVELSKSPFRNFELIFGEDIRKYYLEDNYDNSRRSTLQNSCMRYQGCQGYFDIYVENPKVCQMLIRRSDLDSDKISSRALVWTLSDGKKFMDRIYYSREQDQNLYEEWAKKNGYYYQNRSGSILSPSGSSESDLDLEVHLDKWLFDYYPYMDTLKYLHPETGILCESVSYHEESDYYFLDGQDGDFSREGD